MYTKPWNGPTAITRCVAIAISNINSLKIAADNDRCQVSFYLKINNNIKYKIIFIFEEQG